MSSCGSLLYHRVRSTLVAGVELSISSHVLKRRRIVIVVIIVITLQHRNFDAMSLRYGMGGIGSTVTAVGLCTVFCPLVLSKRN